jgi:hypothetical protein
LHQTILYAAAYEEATGQPVESAVLVYAHPELEAKEVDPAANRAAAIESLRRSYNAVQDAHRADHWPADPRPLCAWCPYLGVRRGAAVCVDDRPQALSSAIPYRCVSRPTNSVPKRRDTVMPRGRAAITACGSAREVSRRLDRHSEDARGRRP